MIQHAILDSDFVIAIFTPQIPVLVAASTAGYVRFPHARGHDMPSKTSNLSSL